MRARLACLCHEDVAADGFAFGLLPIAAAGSIKASSDNRWRVLAAIAGVGQLNDPGTGFKGERGKLNSRCLLVGV